MLARPAVISMSTASSRPSLTTIVETMARSDPARISGASVATRWEPSVAQYQSASTRFVFPNPFGPTNTVRPGVSSRSSSAQERKSCNARWRTYIGLAGHQQPDGRAAVLLCEHPACFRRGWLPIAPTPRGKISHRGLTSRATGPASADRRSRSAQPGMVPARCSPPVHHRLGVAPRACLRW